MQPGSIMVKRRVWVALLGVILITAVWWAWNGSQPPLAASSMPVRQPVVRLTGVEEGSGGQVLRERTELFDPTPLFFPTERNYGQRPLRESVRRQPAQVFRNFEPEFTFAEQTMKVYGTEAVLAPEKLSDVLEKGNEAPFAGMGRVDAPQPTLSIRSAFLEIKQIADGKVIVSKPLMGLSLPRQDFAPLEFIVAVGSAGVIGEPILTSGSEGEEVDSFFRDYLVKAFRLGERLSPGRYRVLVGR